MDYCVNNQIFYSNLFNPPKQLEQQTLINQTFNPQASNTYAQTDDKTFVLPYLPVEMQQNSAEKYAPDTNLILMDIKLVSELPGTPIQLQNFRSSSATITPTSFLSPEDKTTSLNVFNSFSGREMPATELFLYERFSRIVFIAGGFLQ